MSGGFLIALSLIIGVAIGVSQGQASIGFVGGLAVGIVLAAAIWLRDRSRR
ncbi:MAG: hypothetical protein V4574_19410 [Pseudomonadota bacterium]